MDRILEVIQDGRVVKWYRVADLIPDRDCDVRLATCGDPGRVYQSVMHREKPVVDLADLDLL